MKTKSLLLIIAVLLSVFNSGIAQESFNEKLEKYFEGGAENFNKVMYPSLKYPLKARENCVMGSTYVHLFLNGSGSIDSITFSNELGYGIEKAITKALTNTSGNWNINQPLHLTMFFGFQIGENVAIKGDIKIKAYKSIGGKKIDDCKTNKQLVAEFTKLIKKEKYKKAKKRINELLKRDPESEHFKGLMRFVEDKIK